MKPFKLQTVLNYRKRCADEAQKALLDALETQNQAARVKKTAEDALNELLSELESAKEKDIRIPEIILYEECIAAKKQEVANLAKKLAGAEEAVRQRRTQLVQARQEKRALELLKERREAMEEKKRADQENSLMDEIAVIRFGGDR
jgi:flagellar export protein FliJ